MKKKEAPKKKEEMKHEKKMPKAPAKKHAKACK